MSGNSKYNGGPGRAEREGLSWVELMRIFPSNEVAEGWFAEQRWGGSPVCPHCTSENIQTGAKHPTMPYRSPDVPEAVQFADRHGDGGHEARLSGVGRRDLHPHHWHQGRVQHETAPRPRRHAEDRLVARAPHPSDVGAPLPRRSPAPSKSMRRTLVGGRLRYRELVA